jgi:spore maturation protein CgeB
VGNRGGTNVGESFERTLIAAKGDVCLLEAHDAMRAPTWLRLFNWHVRGHRPTRLFEFSEHLVNTCESYHAQFVIVSGISGVTSVALRKLAKRGIRTVNYLTDDPWNHMHRTRWFFEALPEYTTVFSTRTANIADLRNLGCHDVRYLPFGYDPSYHFPERLGPDDADQFRTDVVFIGGADSDRIPYCAAIIQSGLSLALYGDQWARYRSTRHAWKGYADLSILRKATRGAKVCLCIGRRANRDGHAMRSFEIPAMGGCMLAEDTEEHREIFGKEGHAVVYFSSIPQMIAKARWLLAHPDERSRLATTAYALITGGKNTYADRLETILRHAEEFIERNRRAGVNRDVRQ